MESSCFLSLKRFQYQKVIDHAIEGFCLKRRKHLSPQVETRVGTGKPSLSRLREYLIHPGKADQRCTIRVPIRGRLRLSSPPARKALGVG
jgi:hypothetical protein